MSTLSTVSRLTKALVLSIALVFVVAACDQPAAIEQTPDEPEISENAKAINESLTYVAKTLSAALVDKDVRHQVKAETGKMFDGDHNVLFKTIAEQPVRGKMSFGSVLAEKRAGMEKAAGATAKSVQDELRAIAEEMPKVNIGVPVHHKDWNAENYVPLVAVHPEGIDDMDVNELTAYDAEGNVHVLSANEAPERPVVVISLNERVNAEGKLRQPAQICLYQEAKCGGGGGGGYYGGGSTGGGGTTEDARAYGDYEYLQRARVLDDNEKWPLEDPEVMIEVRGETQTSINDYGLKQYDLNWPGGGMFGDDTSWRSYDTFFFTWSQNDAGGFTIWNVYEYDEGESINFTITYEGKDYGFNWTNDNDPMGYQAVQFENDDDLVYDLGDIKFETESKNP